MTEHLLVDRHALMHTKEFRHAGSLFFNGITECLAQLIKVVRVGGVNARGKPFALLPPQGELENV